MHHNHAALNWCKNIVQYYNILHVGTPEIHVVDDETATVVTTVENDETVSVVTTVENNQATTVVTTVENNQATTVVTTAENATARAIADSQVITISESDVSGYTKNADQHVTEHVMLCNETVQITESDCGIINDSMSSDSL